MTPNCFEDIAEGTQLAVLPKGVLTPAHIMRWSAAIENWHRIHYDARFAREHDGLPDVLINGSWKQHVMVQLVKDGLGAAGWVWKLRFRYKAMDVVGDNLTGIADIASKTELDGLGFVGLRLRLLNQREQTTTVGTAIGVLPLRGGRAVPYPFVAKPEYAALGYPDGLMPLG